MDNPIINISNAIQKQCPDYDYINKPALAKDLLLSVLGSVFPVVSTYTSALSNAQLHIITNRLNDLQDLFLNLLKEDDSKYFTHRNILIKYVGDGVVLDDTLQQNLSEYIHNNRDDVLYNDVIDWLLNTSTHKLNKSLNTTFTITFTDKQYILSANVSDYETDILKVLGYYHPLFGEYGGGDNRDIKINPFGIEVYTNVLKLLNPMHIDEIDELKSLRSSHIDTQSLTTIDMSVLDEDERTECYDLLQKLNSEHKVDFQVEKNNLKRVRFLLSKLGI